MSNSTQSINDKWKKTTQAQTAQKNAQYQNEKATIQSQVGKTNQQYAAMKNEAVTNRRMQDRATRERMANMGLSGAGGTSRTHAQRNANNLNNQLGSIAQQKQDYTNNVNTALANLDRQYNADVSALAAQNDASRNAELLSQQQWQAGHDLQQRQLDASQQQWQQEYDAQQRQWQQQFDTSQQQWQKDYDLQNRQYNTSAAQSAKQLALEERNALLQTAYNLYVKRKISKQQYQALTGIRLT